MAYLIPSDFLAQIQDVSLQQVISGKPAFRTSAEQKAQAEISSYLRQKYDIAKEFTNTLPYDPTKIYNAADRVYLDAQAYSDTATYTLGQLIVQAGNVYICAVAIAVPEAFTLAHWTQLGAQYDIFFANYPYPPFDIYGDYKRGDRVWYKNHTYTCRQDTRRYSHDDYLQFHDQNNIPLKNFFPDDPVNGSTNWQDNGVFLVPAGSLLNDSYFTKGDNRDQQLLMYYLDIAIYHLYCRIAPKSIPEERAGRYTVAISTLRMAARGEIDVNLPKLQPKQGSIIRSGGNIKNINSY